MSRTLVMRLVLRVGGAFNLAVAALLLMPGAGQRVGLPAPGPHFYTWILVLFIALFGCAYLWLARRARIDRPLVGLAAIGKLGVFAIALACWLLGEIGPRAVAPAVGDLLFGLVFLWWLAGDKLDA